MADLTVVGSGELDGLSETEWEEHGRSLVAAVSRTCWDIGDWLNYAETAWGERYRRASEITGLAEQTLRNYAMVARRFQMSRRRYKLSFQHYALVAAIPEEAADMWLQVAQAEGFSLHQFRKALPQQLPPGKPEVVVTVFKVTVPHDHEARWKVAAEHRGLDVEDWLVAVADEAAASVAEAA